MPGLSGVPSLSQPSWVTCTEYCVAIEKKAKDYSWDSIVSRLEALYQRLVW